MRKGLIIIAAVGGYSLIELGLLLSSISMRGTFYPNSYEVAIYAAQLLIIPGLGALFSRVMYGPYGWKRRTLAILLVGPFLGPIAIIALIIPMMILAWAFDISQVLFDLLLPLVLGGMAVGLFVAVRKSGRWAVRAEAARWLAERQSGVDLRERRWRDRSIRLASWIPMTIVLLVFLFLPEVWGIVSHLRQPGSGTISRYQVPIPATWIVLSYKNQRSDGWSSVTGLAGRGIGRGVTPYLRGDPPFSSWDIGTDSYGQTVDSIGRRWMPENDEVVSRRIFAIGSDYITCLDYWPSHLRRGPYQRPQHFEDSSIAYVRCSDGRRFYASLIGPRRQVATFYGMLAGATPTK